MTSAPVTDWPLRVLLVAIMIALIALVFFAMRRNWRRRAQAQDMIPAPQSMPVPLPDDDPDVVAGVYLGSVFAGRWLDRIVVHGLGVRSRVFLEIGLESINLEREGAPSFAIPITDLIAVRADRGIAGKAYERGGIAIITWQLGDTAIDSGVRADRLIDQEELITKISALVPPPERGNEQA